MRRSWIRSSLLAATIACALDARAGSPPLALSVAPISLEDLVRSSEVIAFARVTRVEQIHRDESLPAGEPRAEWPRGDTVSVGVAEVVRLVKGDKQLERVVFLAEPTWACDVSAATPGESALFFFDEFSWRAADGLAFEASLAKLADGAPFFSIAHSGQGKMALRKVGGIDHATYWTDVVMPADVPSIDGPEPESARFIRSTPLKELEARVSRLVLSQGALWRAREWSSGHGSPLWSIAIWRDGHFETRGGPGAPTSGTTIPDESLLSILEGDRFLSWPDELLSISEQRILTLEICSNGHATRRRLPALPAVDARFSPEQAELVRTWLELARLSSSSDAHDDCTRYYEALNRSR